MRLASAPALDCWRPDVERMEPAEALRMQEVGLREQFEHVRATSPFYEQKLNEAGIRHRPLKRLADLAQLPFTTKEELRVSQIGHPPLGAHAAVPMDDVIRVHSSSGTTGRPSYVGITRADRDAWTEVIARVYWCEGVRPFDVVVHAFGLSFFVGGLPLKDAFEEIGATFVPIGTGASERVVTSARDLGATVLTCTPSYAQYLAQFVRERHSIEPSELGFDLVAVGAEPGGGIPAVRERIAADFGARVSEGLGNADLLPVFLASCPHHDGMHFVAPDHLLLEVIDPETGKVLPWEDGVEGELVATHLQRECVPLIRFRTRDRVAVAMSPCPCGRTGPRLRCIGRTDDMLIVAGVNVWPSAISDVLGRLEPAVTGAFEVLLESPGPKVAPPLRLRVERAPDQPGGPELARAVESHIRDHLVVPCRVEVVDPGTLPRFEMKATYIRRLYEEPAATAGGASR